MVGETSGEVEALTVNVSVAALTSLAKTNVVNHQTIVGSLMTNALNTDLIGLADYSGTVELASTSVVNEVSSHALITVFGDQVVSLAVELRINAFTETQSLSFCTTSQRTNNAFALSIDNSSITIFAGEAISSEVIIGCTER